MRARRGRRLRAHGIDAGLAAAGGVFASRGGGGVHGAALAAGVGHAGCGLEVLHVARHFVGWDGRLFEIGFLH